MTLLTRDFIILLLLISQTDGFYVTRMMEKDEVDVNEDVCKRVKTSHWLVEINSGGDCKCSFPRKTFYFNGTQVGCLAQIDGCRVEYMESTKDTHVFKGRGMGGDCELETAEISNNDGTWSTVEADIDFGKKDTKIKFDDETFEYDGALIKAHLASQCFISCVVLKLQGEIDYNDRIFDIKPTTTTTTTLRPTPQTPPPITTTTKATFLPSPATFPPWTTTNSPPKTPPPITTTTTTKATFPPSPATFPPWTTTNSPPKTQKTTSNIIIVYPPTTANIPTTSGNIEKKSDKIISFMPLGGFIAIMAVIVLLLVVVVCLFINRRRCFGSKECSKKRQPSPDFIPPPAENPYYGANNYADVSETCFAMPVGRDANNKQPHVNNNKQHVHKQEATKEPVYFETESDKVDYENSYQEYEAITSVLDSTHPPLYKNSSTQPTSDFTDNGVKNAPINDEYDNQLALKRKVTQQNSDYDNPLSLRQSLNQSQAPNQNFNQSRSPEYSEILQPPDYVQVDEWLKNKLSNTSNTSGETRRKPAGHEEPLYFETENDNYEQVAKKSHKNQVSQQNSNNPTGGRIEHDNYGYALVNKNSVGKSEQSGGKSPTHSNYEYAYADNENTNRNSENAKTYDRIESMDNNSEPEYFETEPPIYTEADDM